MYPPHQQGASSHPNQVLSRMGKGGCAKGIARRVVARACNINMCMEMPGQYPNPYSSYQPYDVRPSPSGQSAPLAASTSRQNRRAQQAARNIQKVIVSQKRKITTPSLPSDDDGTGGLTLLRRLCL
eukprot:1555358-Pyramimonas_sp.AAC.1